MRHAGALTGALLTAAWLLGGCTSSADELPSTECADGYMAPALEGCSSEHGGARNEFTESLHAALDALPKGEPDGYVCGDGWISRSLGDPGACSWHHGVYGLIYPDGTRLLTKVTPMQIVHPDGTTETIPEINP